MASALALGATPAVAASMDADCAGLQAALDQAGAGDIITLTADCTGQTFELRTRDSADGPYTLQGQEPDAGTRLEGDGEVRLLTGDGVGKVIIRNLTFAAGFAQAVEGVDQGDGGAIWLTGDSPVTISGDVFLANAADDDGGAVHIAHDGLGPIVVTGSRFGDVEDGNTARGSDGGGLSIDADSAVTISQSVFEGNGASDDGGGARIAATGPVDISDNDFVANRTRFDAGGGLDLESQSDYTLAGNAFTANEAPFQGGGANVASCGVGTLEDNTFDANRLDPRIELERRSTRGLGSGFQRGAGLSASQGCNDVRRGRGADAAFDLVQRGNRFRDNVIARSVFQQFCVFVFERGGAGEHVSGLAVHSTDDRFVRNVIEYAEFQCKGTFVPDHYGAGLAVRGSGARVLLEARNLVAAGNRIDKPEPVLRGTDGGRPSRGGGLALQGFDSDFRVLDSTVVGNVADVGSGIDGKEELGQSQTRTLSPADMLVLHNSIVWDEGPDDEIGGFRVEREVRHSDTCFDNAPHPDGDGSDPNSNICADPLLAGPADDENVDQQATSPTLDAGDDSLVPSDLTADYAGDARISDSNRDGVVRVDMGADERLDPRPPAPAPAAPARPAAPPAAAVLGVQRRSCVSRRTFRIRIRVPRGERALSATVRVNGKRVKVVRGRRLQAPVVLRGLPRGRFSVRITLRLASGETVSGVRRYNTCIPRLPGDGPPRL